MRKKMITKANELSKNAWFSRRADTICKHTSRYHSIFSSLYSPSHLHIHIYAGVPVVRARAGAFNASIKQRVTPSNNSIKLRSGAVGCLDGWLVSWLVSWLVESSRANAITFIRRLTMGIELRDKVAEQHRDLVRFLLANSRPQRGNTGSEIQDANC